MKRLIWGFMPVVILSLGIAFADTHYVSKNGSDQDPYTSWETAADSIQAAIDAAERGDTVMVGAGYYRENIVLTPDIALIGAGFDSCTIDGGTEDFYVVIMADSCGIEGFHVKGGWNHIYSVGIVLNCMDTWVKSNKVTDCYWGINTYSSYHLVENNILIDNVNGLGVPWPCSPTFKNNTIIGGKYALASTGIYSFFSECTIINNLIYNHTEGINAEAWDSSYIANNLIYNCRWEAIFLDEIAPGVIVENNTAFKTGQESGMQAIFCISSSAQLINNIVIGGDRGVRTWAGILHLYYNNVWGSNTYYVAEGGGSIDTVIGNIHEDPMFVDSLDFHLQMHSPCIDAGHPDILDRDSSRSDMGAFGGPLGESYVYQNLPPKAPDSLKANLVDSMVILLDWQDNTESDLAYYLIYRDTVQDFIPDTSMVIAQIDKDTSFYQDFDFDFSYNYYYPVRAYDNSLQGGEFSNQAEVRFTSVFPWDDDPENLPHTFELSQNYPNPFNPQTTISYYLPDVGYQPAEVELKIYNLLGELVKTLVSERQYPGTYRASWDGTDDYGKEVASGIYFYELKVSGIPFVSAKKMVLVR